MSNFKDNQEVFYVSPFTFHIERVSLIQQYEMMDYIGWIEGTGAYLEEKDLFSDLKEARVHALKGLLEFYNKRVDQILNNEPQFEYPKDYWNMDNGEMNEFSEQTPWDEDVL